AGRAAMLRPPASTSSGVRTTRSLSGNKRDTVDLLQRGAALAHRVERGVAQEPGAGALRSVAEPAHRGPVGDELAQLVVQDHELGDGHAPLVARAAALAAALARDDLPLGDIALRQPG